MTAEVFTEPGNRSCIGGIFQQRRLKRKAGRIRNARALRLSSSVGTYLLVLSIISLNGCGFYSDALAPRFNSRSRRIQNFCGPKVPRGTQRRAVASSDLGAEANAERKGPSKRKKKSAKKAMKKKKASKKDKNYPTSSVVSRLSRAASRAAEKQAEEEPPLEEEAQAFSSPVASHPLASLTQLTRAIDQQLTNKSSRSRMPRLAARDSMAAVVSYNYQQNSLNLRRDGLGRSFEAKQVAVVFSRPLMGEDQISKDYANRIRRLVWAMQTEEYKPDVICFVGGSFATNEDEQITMSRPVLASDVGYIFFRHMCAAQGVSLDSVSYIYMKECKEDFIALRYVARYLLKDCIPSWEFPRLRIQVSLVSSDYHLCQLHELHLRSPNQSPLRALAIWPTTETKNIKTSWTYVYATSAPVLAHDNDVQAFFLKCFQTAQQLRIVVVNLRGVVEHCEFFQRENYLVLVSARRSLVTDMEGIYHVQPSLKSFNRLLINEKPMDVVLESALTSMGRCLDLVRPAGLLTGSVPERDWKLALAILEQAVDQISITCNPDQPLDPWEWGSMVEYEEGKGLYLLNNHNKETLAEIENETAHPRPNEEEFEPDSESS